jgi:competence protein ComEC
VLETRDQAWLYDAGPRYSPDSDAGERVVLPFLRSRGIEVLDGVVVSHLDQNHSGGAAAILRGIPVRRLLTSVPADHSVLGGASAQPCIAGQHFGEGELRLRVLHPTAEDYARRLSANAMSCVVEARAGAVSVLLTGDVPAREEGVLIKREPDLRATWMMVPHHGSSSSSSAGFLDAVKPAVATGQTGYRNRFGHPDPAVVARYAARGVDFVRPIMRVPRSGGLARAVASSHAPGAPSRCATGTTAPARGIPHCYRKAMRKSREKGSLASLFSGCRRPKDWCTSC